MSKSIKYLLIFAPLSCPLFLFAEVEAVPSEADMGMEEITDDQSGADEGPPADQEPSAKSPIEQVKSPESPALAAPPPAKAAGTVMIEPAPGGGCTPGARCSMPDYPYEPPQAWRYVSGIGWRKFSPEGAMRKDWWDYKRTRPYRRY